MRLQDKVIIITGAARHIGREFAARAAREGARVTAADILDCTETAELVQAAGGEVLTLKTDVTDEAQVKEMARQTAERFGRIDALVNNAGIYDGLSFSAIEDVDLDVWDRVMEVNVKGVFLGARAVYPYMREQGGGKIVNIGSSIWLESVTGLPHYVASKAAVTGLTRTLAMEMGQHNIAVNAIAPGMVESGAVVDRAGHPGGPGRAGRLWACLHTR